MREVCRKSNTPGIGDWPMRSERGDQDTMSRPSQWLLDAREEVRIGCGSR